MIDSARRKSTACLKRNTNRLTGESTPTLQAKVGLRADDGLPANGSQTALSPNNGSTDLFSTSVSLETPALDQGRRHEQLAAVILKRIQIRLPGRVRRLTVNVKENAVVLAGKCSTFYTKQLAQHVAMGVLEDERLINNIEVCH